MQRKLKEWMRQAEEILSNLEKVQELREWKFKQKKLKGAEKIGFDDSSWEKIKLPHPWFTGRSTTWLRKEIIFPSFVEGISLRGSKVELTIFSPSGVEVFLDGISRLKYDWWADTRPKGLNIIDKIEPSRSYLLVYKFPKKDGLGTCQSRLHIRALEEVFLKLSTLVEELIFVQKVLLKDNRSLRENFSKVVELLDVSSLKRRDWQKIFSSIKDIEQALAPFQDQAKKYKVYLVGHSHIDMNWLWPWEETVKVCQRDFKTVDNLMDEYPELHFSQSQVSVYKVVEEKDPSLFQKIRQRIKEGRWEVTASTWVEGDLNMAAGESLARQLLYARSFCEEKLDSNPEICWEPDTFGHPVSYPQVLAKSGIKYYYFMRGGRGLPIFWWEAPDESRVLAFNSVYNGEITAKNIVSTAIEIAHRYGIKSSMYLFGVGDHGGGPTRKDIQTKMYLDKKPALPKLIFSSAQDFYRQALSEKTDYPVVKEELNPVFEGCYTTHSDIKKMNREGENLLLTSEVFSTLASLHGYQYPKESLREAWQKLCFNQFHDILSGSAIHTSYEYSSQLAKEVEKTARKMIDDSLTYLSSHIKTEGKGKPLLVFNQLGWKRTDLVEVDLPEDVPSSFHLLDEKNNPVPFQIEKEKLIFIARDVPAFGYKTYWLVQGKKEVPPSKLMIDPEGSLENPYYLLQVDPDTGVIVRLFDKKACREILYPCPTMEKNPGTYLTHKASNLLQLYTEAPHFMSAWIIGNIEKVENLISKPLIQVEQKGPVQAILSVHRTFRNSRIVQKIILYQDLARIDFQLEVNWQEKGSPETGIPLLRVVFNLNFLSTGATYEIPFGSIKRVSLGEELPALRWVDVSEPYYGVSLLNNCKHGHRIEADSISLALLRSPYEPDSLSDIGIHQIGYAIYPHHGKWQRSWTAKRAAEFNQPLIARWTDVHLGSLPSSWGLIEVEGNGFVPSGLKKAEDGRGMVFRFYETEGEKTNVSLKFSLPITSCWESDLLEKRKRANLCLSGDKIRLIIFPYEIKTLRMEVKS